MPSPFNYKNTYKDPGIKTERLNPVVVTGETKQIQIKKKQDDWRSGKYPKFEKRIQKPNIPTVTVPKYKESYKPLLTPKIKTKQLLPQTGTIQRFSPKEQIKQPTKLNPIIEAYNPPKFEGAQPLAQTQQKKIYSTFKQQMQQLKNR